MKNICVLLGCLAVLGQPVLGTDPLGENEEAPITVDKGIKIDPELKKKVLEYDELVKTLVSGNLGDRELKFDELFPMYPDEATYSTAMEFWAEHVKSSPPARHHAIVGAITKFKRTHGSYESYSSVRERLHYVWNHLWNISPPEVDLFQPWEKAINSQKLAITLMYLDGLRQSPLMSYYYGICQEKHHFHPLLAALGQQYLDLHNHFSLVELLDGESSTAKCELCTHSIVGFMNPFIGDPNFPVPPPLMFLIKESQIVLKQFTSHYTRKFCKEMIKMIESVPNHLLTKLYFVMSSGWELNEDKAAELTNYFAKTLFNNDKATAKKYAAKATELFDMLIESYAPDVPMDDSFFDKYNPLFAELVALSRQPLEGFLLPSKLAQKNVMELAFIIEGSKMKASILSLAELVPYNFFMLIAGIIWPEDSAIPFDMDRVNQLSLALRSFGDRKKAECEAENREYSSTVFLDLYEKAKNHPQGQSFVEYLLMECGPSPS